MRSERTYYRAIAGDAAQFAPGNVFFVALALYVMLIQLLVRYISYLHRFITRVSMASWNVQVYLIGVLSGVDLGGGLGGYKPPFDLDSCFFFMLIQTITDESH